MKPRQLLALLGAVVAGVVLRIPALYNAAALLNSDEAVNALFIRHLVAGRELALHPWDVTYYGIVEGLLALPFAAVLGFTPLAFKLAAVAGLVALQLAACRLGWLLYGANEGIAAALLLAAFSPQLVSWSTLAVGGIVLVVAWGTLTVCRLHTWRRDPSPWRAAALGFMIGFGLYIHELYVVYVAALAAWALGALWAWRGATAAANAATAATAPTVGAAVTAAAAPAAATAVTNRRPLRTLAFVGAGLAVGAIPIAVPLLHGAHGSKVPLYRLASLEVMAANLRLLAGECVPALFGVHAGGHRRVLAWEVGPSWPGAEVAGALLLAAYAAAWLWGVRSALRRRSLAGAEGLLVLLVPVTALLFIASPNARSVLSFHYLLPWLTSLSVFAGAALVGVARRSRPAAAALALLLVALPACQIAAWYRGGGLLDEHLRLVRLRVPLAEVAAYLEGQGIRGAYGWYWVAYKATMLAGERLIVAPLDDWDRYPPYTRSVGRLSRVAYIFEVDFDRMRAIESEQARRRLADFRNRLESAGATCQEKRIGPYLILYGRGGERLLPAGEAAPVPLRAARAEVALGPVPARAGVGEWLRIPVRFTNRSDAAWSAAGMPLAAGSLRVTAAYRWFDPSGRAAVEYGERSLLPGDVAVGEAMPMVVRVLTPARPGPYDLEITLVQDGVAWFDQATGSASQRRRVAVGGPAAGPSGPGAPGAPPATPR
ncbi:MAG TPA: hypothetical protein VMW75_23905 [Thermoanaerobaculia bacterium]|nr:hypothetical protein [Thermoanaerobaculia bacterium]